MNQEKVYCIRWCQHQFRGFIVYWVQKGTVQKFPCLIISTISCLGMSEGKVRIAPTSDHIIHCARVRRKTSKDSVPHSMIERSIKCDIRPRFNGDFTRYVIHSVHFTQNFVSNEPEFIANIVNNFLIPWMKFVCCIGWCTWCTRVKMIQLQHNVGIL